MKEINKEFVLRLEAIIDTAIDGIITISDKGIIETMNPAAAGIFQFESEEVVGRNIKMLMPEPYHSDHDQYIDNYNKTRKPRIIGIGREVIGLKKSGVKFPFRLAVSEVILNDRVIFTGIIHDLTAVKFAEEETLQLNRELEAKVAKRTYELEKVVNQLLSTNKKLELEMRERVLAEQKLKDKELRLLASVEKEKELNEMKSRFVSIASHEFRTPLTSILSSAALIGKYSDEESQNKRIKHVDKIKAAVSNLTGILNDFLSLSRLEEGEFTINLVEFQLRNLCKEVTDATKSLIKSDRKVIHRIHGQEKPIVLDQSILRNVLFNMLSNAIKYSSEDIFCDIYYDREMLEIHVSDTGIGIPFEDQKNLFTRFFRAGNVTHIQGTGLGLNIVQRYVDILDGKITFESTPEEGTTFILKFPFNQMNNEK